MWKGLDTVQLVFTEFHCQKSNSYFIKLGYIVKVNHFFLAFIVIQNHQCQSFIIESSQAIFNFEIIFLKETQFYLSINYDNRFWFEVGFGNLYGGLF